MLIIPAINIRFSKNIIYLIAILFFIFISTLRDPLATTDHLNYLNAIDEKSYMAQTTPTFLLLIYILKDLLGLDTLLTLEIISLIPFICFLISSIILDFPLLTIFFLSSETFVLTSYNAIRQGLSIGFLMLGVSIIIKIVLEKQNITNLKNLIKFNIPLISALTAHVSSLVISFLFVSYYILNKLKISLIKLKIKKSLLILIISLITIIFGIILSRPGIFSWVFNRGLRALSFSYLIPKGFGFSQNHFSSVYRFSIMYAAYFYTKAKLNKFPKDILVNKNIIHNLLNMLNLSFIPLIFICLLQAPFILSRLSLFYIIPLSISIFFLNKLDNKIRLFNSSLFSIMGLITYSSKAVIVNLLAIKNIV